VVTTPEFVQVRIDTTRVSWLMHSRTAVLHDVEGDRYLLILIGRCEAAALAQTLQSPRPQRPMGHDLTLRMLELLGGQVQQVAINRLAEQTFYAEITLAQGRRRHEIDARPSDALALAVHTGVPIYVARPLLDAAGVALSPPSEEQPAARQVGE
jgi:bifunctional DNase/RNase